VIRSASLKSAFESSSSQVLERLWNLRMRRQTAHGFAQFKLVMSVDDHAANLCLHLECGDAVQAKIPVFIRDLADQRTREHLPKPRVSGFGIIENAPEQRFERGQIEQRFVDIKDKRFGRGRRVSLERRLLSVNQFALGFSASNS
jgi:hypothetical protein